MTFRSVHDGVERLAHAANVVFERDHRNQHAERMFLRRAAGSRPFACGRVASSPAATGRRGGPRTGFGVGGRPRYGSGLSPPISSRRIVTGRSPSGATSRFKLGEQLVLGRRSLAGEVELLDPQQPDAVGAVVEGQLDVVLDADIGFDADQLAVERAGRLAAGSFAAHERGRATFPIALGIRSRRGLAERSRACRESRRPESSVPLATASKNARDLGDRGDALFAGEQGRVRALPQRFDDHGRHVGLRAA